MRKIKKSEGFRIDFSFAGTEGEGIITAQINIPIDGNKYVQGVNIIESIRDRLLPLVDVAAINQVLDAGELNLLNGFTQTGIFSPSLVPGMGGVAFYLLNNDDASLGVVSFVDGDTKPTYI